MPDIAEPQTDHEILLAFWRDWSAFKTGDWVDFKVNFLELRKTLYGGNGERIGLVAAHAALREDFTSLRKIANWIAAGIVSAVGILLLGIFTGRIDLIFH